MAASISPRFVAKKNLILANLSMPEADYMDASPKGSVDVGIRELIDLANGVDGAVTTSSCAGRISVFQEGMKTKGDFAHTENSADASSRLEMNGSQNPVPGGKGLGGRWLFVSHEPIQVEDGSIVQKLFGSKRCDCSNVSRDFDPATCRLVKFAFEPMILHVMTASLHHAKPILAAALDSGFRESGVQSLKSLEDSNAFPMVAVRTAGLGLSSVIGIVHAGCDSETGAVHVLVDDAYLRVLLALANERFNANSERIRRLQESLSRLKEPKKGRYGDDWEDRAVRAERKRAEGLRERALLRERIQREEREEDYGGVEGDEHHFDRGKDRGAAEVRGRGSRSR